MTEYKSTEYWINFLNEYVNLPRKLFRFYQNNFFVAIKNERMINQIVINMAVNDLHCRIFVIQNPNIDGKLLSNLLFSTEDEDAIYFILKNPALDENEKVKYMLGN